jgi:trans-2,3-dihydro-3-hydroxyanthranilate isomerase
MRAAFLLTIYGSRMRVSTTPASGFSVDWSQGRYGAMANLATNLDYFVVDVFTETPLAGNPLAVVLNTCGLTTEQMQAIAREFNLSETTFIERRSAEVERAEGVRVRVFTTQEELPFAGHPTLGTASVLKMIAPETLLGDTVTLALKVGPVPVRFAPDAADRAAISGEMTQREPEFGAELDAAEVAPLLGLAFDDLDPALPPQVVSTGAPFAIVVLRSMEALARLKVDQEKATAWLRQRGGRWFYVLAPDLIQDENGAKHQSEDGAKHQNQNPMKWCARMQFYGGEDPATGSAAGCAISYLVARGAAPSGTRVHVRQGVEVGRPSDLYLSAKRDFARVTDVRVAGSTVLVAKGQLFLP